MFERSEKKEPADRQGKEEGGGKADGATLAKSNKAELRGKKTHSDSCTEIRLKR